MNSESKRSWLQIVNGARYIDMSFSAGLAIIAVVAIIPLVTTIQQWLLGVLCFGFVISRGIIFINDLKRR